MNTNQLMTVAFNSGEVEVFHKTAMANLTQLWSVGNRMRLLDGKAIANLTTFINSARTKEFTAELEKQGMTAFEITGKGNTKRTWACLELMIYAAEYLSVSFHVEVIQTLIKGKLLEFRDESGDNFKAMNIAIDNHLGGREGKDNLGVRIQVAKMIKHKVNPELTCWNSATAHDLRYRSEIEDRLTTVLNLDLVSDYAQLKEIIQKI